MVNSSQKSYHHTPSRYATLRKKYYFCPDCLTWIIRDRKHDLFLCLQCGRKETRDQFRQTLKHNQENYVKDRTADRLLMKATSTRLSTGVVYYLEFNGLIKIGTTSNLKKRLESIPWDNLLLTEPGTYQLERQRHEQFKNSHRRHEWFHKTQEVLSFIEMRKEELKEYNRMYWNNMPAFPWEYGIYIPERKGTQRETAENLKFLARHF